MEASKTILAAGESDWVWPMEVGELRSDNDGELGGSGNRLTGLDLKL